MQPNRAGERACTPATVSSLPREALTDLRIRYRMMAALLGVEEPHGLSTRWDHDQPRREELTRHHPAMEAVMGNDAQMAEDESNGYGDMPAKNDKLTK